MKEMVSLMIILFLTTGVFAQNTFTIEVSFVIPEIPGLNSPLIEEESVLENQKSSSITELKNDSAGEEDLSGQNLISQLEEKPDLKLITLYSR